MSLRRQFVLSLAAFSVAVAGAFGFLAWSVASDALETEMEKRLIWFAGGAASSRGIFGTDVINLRPGEEDLVSWTMIHARLATMTEEYVRDAFLFDASDSLNYRALVTAAPADSIPIGTPLNHLAAYRPEINQAITDGSATTRRFLLDDGSGYHKYGFLHLWNVTNPEGPPVILAVLIPADFFEPMGQLGSILLWGSVVAIVIAVALGGYLAAKVAKPLERLSRVALRIQRGHMDRNVEAEAGVELGRLARAMERMRLGVLRRDEQLRLMLAQVAHEIRNPLGGLELFAAAAAETADPKERQRLLGRVRGEVDSLNRIINDFLNFARPLQARRHGVDLRQPIREAAELAKGELAKEGVQLEVLVPDEALMAVVDTDQVKGSVFNLIRNAADVASRVRVCVERHGSEILISVSDNGPGVPEEIRQRIFEPFITDKEKGAGLGLAIVRKVAEAHGGRVTVGDASDETFENGADFRLYFAGLEEPPLPPSEESAHEEEGSRLLKTPEATSAAP